MLNQLKILFKNESVSETISYFFATVFSKGVSYIGFFLIVRIMSKSEVGLIELFNSNVNFFLPFASLELHECFLRFTPKMSEKKEIYRSNIFFMFFLESLFLFLFSLIFKNSRLLIFGIISLNMVTYATYFARAEDRKILFKLKEILGTTIQYLFLFIFIYIGFNYDGYIYAFIISNIIVSCIIFVKMKEEFRIYVQYVNFNNLKILLDYALPLIPNAFGWWLISSSDRWMINWFVGTESVAIYSVATKFSSLIMMIMNNVYFVVQNRFFLSGHEIERNQICNIYIFLTILVSLAGVMLPSFILKFIVGIDYTSSVSLFYLYAPTTMYWALGAFYGIGSQISKKTMVLTVTMFISACINVLVNYIFIQKIGIEGAIIGSVISLFVWFITRYYYNREIMNVTLNRIQIIAIFTIQIISIIHYLYLI